MDNSWGKIPKFMLLCKICSQFFLDEISSWPFFTKVRPHISMKGSLQVIWTININKHAHIYNLIFFWVSFFGFLDTKANLVFHALFFFVSCFQKQQLMSLWLILFLTMFKFAYMITFGAQVKWPPNTCSLIDIMFCFSLNFYATSWTWIFFLQGNPISYNFLLFKKNSNICLSNWYCTFF